MNDNRFNPLEKHQGKSIRRRDFLHMFSVAALGLTSGMFGIPNVWASCQNENDLCYKSASELLKLFKEKQLSPVELLKSQISQIEKENSKLNCITYKHFDQAMGQAKESEKRYQNGNPRALEGITCAIKDENDVMGWRTTMGSLLLKDTLPAKENAAIIDMLQNAGVVMHIQTTVPEFYLAANTWTRLWGITHNPWNLEYSPGGSSGGSGVALAAGFATIATGSDMGGSIRIPCAQCGLYGFKPPFGRVPTSDIAYESLGPMARNFTDMTMMQNVICGPNPKVLSSLRPKMEYPLNYGDIKGWKIAVDRGNSINKLDQSIDLALDDAIKLLRKLGCTVEEVNIGFQYDDFNNWVEGLLSTEMGAMFIDAAKHPELLSRYAQIFIKKFGGNLGPVQAQKAAEVTTGYHRRIQSLVYGQGYQVLIMPTMLTPYLKADYAQSPEKDSVQFDDREEKTYNFVATWVWNMLNRYPVLNVPIGLAPNNIPIGMQIVGNTFDDITAFQVASAYSKVAPSFFTRKLFPQFKVT
ncbi:MAG: amidase [Pseudomonadota bacterium]